MSFKDEFLHLIGLEEVIEGQTDSPQENKTFMQKFLKLIGIEIIEEESDKSSEIR